jgi:hypothetical protein
MTVGFSRLGKLWRQRSLLPALGVIAILLGLLGMHYLPVDSLIASDSMVAMSTSGDIGGPAALVLSPASHGPAAYETSMAMEGMACVLAISITGLFLLIGPGLPTGWTGLKALRSPPRDWRTTTPPPRPPSLDLLSISRT